MDARDLEAARDGVRLLIAEAQRLKFLLDRVPEPATATHHATVMKRAATAAGHAGALVSTLGRSLVESVRTTESSAWSDGIQSGIEMIKPGEVEP